MEPMYQSTTDNELMGRCDTAILAGIRRVIADIHSGFRLIDIQRMRDKTQSWVQEMSFVLDGLYNASVDGLEFLLSTKSLDVVSIKSWRAEIANIRNEAKSSLLEVNSPAIAASVYFDNHHDRLTKYGQSVVKNLEFVLHTSNQKVEVLKKSSVTKTSAAGQFPVQ